MSFPFAFGSNQPVAAFTALVADCRLAFLCICKPVLGYEPKNCCCKRQQSNKQSKRPKSRRRHRSCGRPTTTTPQQTASNQPKRSRRLALIARGRCSASYCLQRQAPVDCSVVIIVVVVIVTIDCHRRQSIPRAFNRIRFVYDSSVTGPCVRQASVFLRDVTRDTTRERLVPSRLSVVRPSSVRRPSVVRPASVRRPSGVRPSSVEGLSVNRRAAIAVHSSLFTLLLLPLWLRNRGCTLPNQPL